MKPKLIFVIGPAGSGKSTIGKILANQTGAAFLDGDSMLPITNTLLESTYHDPNDRESDYYLRNVRPVLYQSMFRIALENLEVGNNVIISSTMTQEIKDKLWLERFMKANERVMKNAAVFVVWLKSSHSADRERMIKRSATKDNWKLKNWDSYLRKMSEYALTWRPGSFEYRMLDNSSNNRADLEKQIVGTVIWLKK